MSQIKQLSPKEGVTLLAVKVPKETYKCAVDGDKLIVMKGYDFYQEWDYKNLPEGNWQLLGIATEIPEEVWWDIVDGDEEVAFRDYKSGKNLWLNATESAMSFLEANEVYSVNPYPFPGCACSSDANKDVTDKCEAENARWSKAEANTGTWVILMKQND